MRRGMALWNALSLGGGIRGRHVHADGTWMIGAVIALVALNAPWPARCAPLLFLGTISYSVYLQHGAIGFSVDNILSLIAEISSTLRYSLKIAAMLALATVFWWLIERPSTLLSQKFGQAARPLPATLAPSAAGS